MNDDQMQTQPPEEDIQKLQKIQTFTTVALIAGPVSLLFGGVLLSAIALICAILAFRRSRSFSDEGSEETQDLIRTLQTQSLAALIITIVTTSINLVSFAFSAATLFSLMESGQLDQFWNNESSLFGSEPVDTDTSIWD